jgi:hypothetical protein
MRMVYKDAEEACRYYSDDNAWDDCTFGDVWREGIRSHRNEIEIMAERYKAGSAIAELLGCAMARLDQVLEESTERGTNVRSRMMEACMYAVRRDVRVRAIWKDGYEYGVEVTELIEVGGPR